MSKILHSVVIAGISIAASTFGASSASAAVNICTGNNCAATTENVLVNAASGVTTVTGSTQTSNLGVLFTSTTDVLLNGNANGQADISSADGLLNGLTFSLTDGATFTSATFNLFPLPGNQPNEATSVVLSYYNPLLGIAGTKTISTNGNNFIGISGDAGELFTSITFVSDPATSGIEDFRQLRLGGAAPAVAAVPETATWGMMILGFGMIGAASRSRKVKTNVNFA
jgi:hypothetical protein